MNCSVPLMVVALLAAGCALPSGPAGGAQAPADWLAWQAKRRESVAGTNGWTTLVMRHWLVEGRNFMGTDPTNHAVLPRGRAADSIGSFIRQGRTVRFEAAPGVQAIIDGQAVSSAEFKSDTNAQPTKMFIGPLSFIVIERGERLGVRVRDPESPARAQFAGLKCFPYDPAWRIEARFEPSAFVRVLRVADIIGGTQEYPCPGTIVFNHAGKEHRLDVVEEEGEQDYFVIFHDETAGVSTYASGRFLYVSRPDASGKMVIDFNRAYTPPCGFTAFATCPLPPHQNWLPFAVPAGELAPAGHH
jgi:uncharacterized protein (DUF1684 family)